MADVANAAGVDVTTLAAAWSKQHDFVASTIVGANTVAQLEASLSAADLVLSEELLGQLDEITWRYPYPLG